MSAYSLDSTSKQQLREQNDLNWERFTAELHAALAQSEARVTAKFSESISEAKTDLMKWIFFVYWFLSILGLGGLMVALLRK